MTVYKTKTPDSYFLGAGAPSVVWTVIRGDTASFKVYVTDDAKQPLNIPDWIIKIDMKRPNSKPGVITDDATLVFSLYPDTQNNEKAGEFIVSLTAAQTEQLQTGDIFDIELSLPQNTTVWTVAQGKMTILEDVTN